MILLHRVTSQHGARDMLKLRGMSLINIFIFQFHLHIHNFSLSRYSHCLQRLRGNFDKAFLWPVTKQAEVNVSVRFMISLGFS